jgi:PAS domain S-box-containing protein
MRARILGCLVHATFASFVAALVLVVVPSSIGAFTNDPSTPSEEQKQMDQDRCKFLMGNVNGTILSLNSEGNITFLNHYGQRFFGYSEDEILGKPMLGTLTPLAGFEGRDLTTFMAGVVHHPNRYAFSVNTNMLRNGKRVWTFWANKGISDNQGEVREVLRVGLDITDRKLRLEALAQELRGIGEMLDGRDWVQRSKLKEITSRIKAISEELEGPWEESDTGIYESAAPPKQ